MIRRRGGGRRRVENSCLHPDDTPSRVSEVGHVEKSSSENSRWECLLGNGPEGQEVKIQSQSRFQVGWLCSPTVPLCHKKSLTYRAGPQRLCLYSDTLTASSQDVAGCAAVSA